MPGSARPTEDAIYIKKSQESTQRGDFLSETQANLLTSETTVPNSLDNANIPQGKGKVKEISGKETPAEEGSYIEATDNDWIDEYVDRVKVT